MVSTYKFYKRTYYKHHGHSKVIYNFKTSNGYEHDENGINLGLWCWAQRKKIRLGTLEPEKIQKLELLNFRLATKKETEKDKDNLCNLYGIEYKKHKTLSSISYQELYAKIMFLIDNNYPLETNDKLHEIFYMSNENMILKYMISKEDLIMNYYINKKGKNV